jgi:arylsulfatase A
MRNRTTYLACSFFFSFCNCFSQKPVQPNIIVILADDLGYGDISCYNSLMPFQTTHIDALANQGIRFTDAHSPSSVCSPTRYGLLTGRYAWRGTLKKGVLLPWDPPLIEKNRLTLPAMLKQSGYATFAVGKWHLGWNWQKLNTSAETDKLGNNINFKERITGGPTDYGFDYYFGIDVPNYPPYAFFENDRLLTIPSQIKPDTVFGNPGIMTPGWSLEKVMPAITGKAVELIGKAAADRAKPFFLYFALTAPHTPIAPSNNFRHKTTMGPYGDYLMEVDGSVGQILHAVKEHHLDENTLIIFTSDNGSPALDGTKMGGVPGSLITRYRHNTNLNFRGLKGDVWEGGHRIPFIVRYGNKIPAGKTSSNPILLTDIMATIAEIIGKQPSADNMEDSRSFLRTLTHPHQPADTERVIVHHSLRGDFGIRKGDWKLILTNKSGGFSDAIHKDGYGIDTPGQLYNLRNDPAETVNLYKTYPGEVERLTTLLQEIQNY